MITSKSISILTASLNMGSTIEHTLESIRNQTYQNYEHIVIDGGSNDGTIEILKKYENSYNLKWISEPDQGISDALNKGYKLSNGRYIMVIQADDQLLTKNILKKVSSLLKTEDYDIHCFPVILDHTEYGQIIRKPIQKLWWNHFKFVFPHQGCFVKRSVFKKLGGFNTQFKICLDYDFFYRALVKNATVNFGSRPVALMGGGASDAIPKT